jgi:sugar (pentulose or hexulose) kinase
MPFESIGSILPKRLEQHGVSAEVSAAVVCQAFDAAIAAAGGPLVGEASAIQYVGKVITVRATSTSAALALQAAGSALAAAANESLGYPAIQQVRVRVQAGQQ